MSLLVLILFIPFSTSIDPKGYLVFCPCMGRFGNQVDQLLGVMQFTKNLDRTLVLPNFIEYHGATTKFIPFEYMFQLNRIKQYQKVITMSDFLKNVAPEVWPKESRKALCWSPRTSLFTPDSQIGCHAKEGSPFGPYWDKLNIDFVGDEYYGNIPGAYEMDVKGSRTEWLNRFNSSLYPVLAFSSAPASFPSNRRVWELQKYLRWGSRVLGMAKQYVADHLQKPFIGVHLRNERDWASVCEHIDSTKNNPLFASAQCLGERHHMGQITKSICSPSTEVVLNAITDAVGSIGAKSVFVASDKDHMLDDINQALKAYEVKAYKLPSDDPYVSLAVLALSDHFIGNCVSTFSHIVKRERDTSANLRPSSYFGFSPPKRKIEL
ncbi:unnamed protein product [Auanema sp. JU1783]|nr:unnamed protein product [Auanema sp. JU1783]